MSYARRIARTVPGVRWTVAGLGAVLVIAVLLAGASGGAPLAIDVVENAVPFVVSLLVAGAGVRLARSDLEPWQVVTLTGWSGVGGVLLAMIAIWTAYVQLPPALFGENVGNVVVVGLSVGAGSGLAVGWYLVRQRAETRRAELARTAVSASIDGVAILDEDEQYVEVNRAFAEAFGVDDSAEMVGEEWREFYPDEQVEAYDREVVDRLREEGRWRGEMLGERPDGSLFPHEVSLSRMETGEFVAVVRDVSERKVRENRLEALHAGSRELMTAGSKAEIAEATVAIARQVLDEPMSAVWRYDPGTDRLVPQAATDGARAAAEAAGADGVPPLGPGTLEREAYRGDEVVVVEEYRAREDAATSVPLGTVILAPLGEYGLLSIGSKAVRDVDPADRYMVEILARNAEAALDRVDREEQLAAREQRLRTIVENVPLVLFALDSEGRFTLSEGRSLTELGFDPGEVVGDSVFEVFEAAPAICELAERTLDGEEVHDTVEFGGRSFEVWYQPIAGAGETRAIGVAVDVTERRKHERGIEALHEATREMVQATDPERIAEIAVETAVDALGMPVTAVWLHEEGPERLRPVAWSDRSGEMFDEPPVYEPGNSLSWRAFERGETFVFDDVSTETDAYDRETSVRSEVIVPVGEYGVINVGSLEPGAFDGGDVALAQLLAANLRAAMERADREADLARRTDQLEFFNSILRHDVLNAVTVIRSRAEFLADRMSEGSDEARYATTIVDWCDDVTEVVRRVRRVLGTLTAESEPSLDPVDASDLLSEQVRRVATTYPGVTVETEIAEGVEVWADELLSDVFGNVVTNAIEHNDAGDLRVTASARVDEAGERAVLRVADDGQGVPDDRKEAVFRRGETGHAKATGSGFGLFFVDSMVEKYGGSVRIEDAEEGGAAFVIELLPVGESAGDAQE